MIQSTAYFDTESDCPGKRWPVIANEDLGVALPIRPVNMRVLDGDAAPILAGTFNFDPCYNPNQAPHVEFDDTRPVAMLL